MPHFDRNGRRIPGLTHERAAAMIRETDAVAAREEE
jgi:hypothetical protein